jgi:hypothetical protein
LRAAGDSWIVIIVEVLPLLLVLIIPVLIVHPDPAVLHAPLLLRQSPWTPQKNLII